MHLPKWLTERREHGPEPSTDHPATDHPSTRHPSSVQTFAAQDDRLTSDSEGGAVRVSDLAGLREPIVLTGHTDVVQALAVLKDGRLASGSEDGTVRVWDLAGSAEPIVLTGHKWESALAVLEDGRLASGSWHGEVRIWDLAGMAEPVVLTGHTNHVNAFAVLKDGRLATGSSDDTVRIWDLAGRAEPVVLTGHTEWVSALAVLEDGRLASASGDGTVRVWDPSVPAEPILLAGHSNVVWALAVLKDGRLASGSEDGTVRVWDLAARAESVVLTGSTDAVRASVGDTDCVRALAVLKDGRLASGLARGPVQVWDLAAQSEPVFVLNGHTKHVNALAGLEDGRLASASADGTVRVWDMAGSAQGRRAASSSNQGGASSGRVEPAGESLAQEFADFRALGSRKSALLEGLTPVHEEAARAIFAKVHLNATLAGAQVSPQPKRYENADEAFHSLLLRAEYLSEGSPIRVFRLRLDDASMGDDFLYVNLAEEALHSGFLVCALTGGGFMGVDTMGTGLREVMGL